jgi:hypothetical protein
VYLTTQACVQCVFLICNVGMAKYSLRSSTLRQRGRNKMKNSSGEVKLQQRQSPRLKAKQRIAAMEKREKKRNALKRKLAKAAKARSDELAKAALVKAAKERRDELAKAAKERSDELAKAEQRDALKHWKNEQLAAFTQAEREVYAAFKHAANEGDILEMAKLWRPLHIDLRFRYVEYDMTTWVEQHQWNQMCNIMRSAFVPSGTN